MTPEVLGPSAPDWLTWAFWARDPESLRNLALAVGAVVGVIVGLPLLCWRTWNVHRQAEAALRQAKTAAQRHEGQAEADRERRITESFTRAVDQLGSEKLETRLGAIYALERIARESQRDHWPIMETLTAYVRERAPWDAEGARQQEDEGVVKFRPMTDVQAALTIIGRRRVEHDATGQRLLLSRTDLRGTDLTGAHLQGVSLERAHLERATLFKAHLESVILARAHLQGATLSQAHLQGAVLFEAHLEGAHLRQAHLQGAVLLQAHLQGAVLEKAHLEGADLTGSDVTQEQLDHACGDASTMLPEGLTIVPCAE